MKSLKLFLLPVLDSLELAWQVIRYALIFVLACLRLEDSPSDAAGMRTIDTCLLQVSHKPGRD